MIVWWLLFGGFGLFLCGKAFQSIWRERKQHASTPKAQGHVNLADISPAWREEEVKKPNRKPIE